MNSKPEIKEKINTALSAAGMNYEGDVKVRHIAEVIYNDIGPGKIKSFAKKLLPGLKVALLTQLIGLLLGLLEKV